jgi:hypothetical protein
MKKIKLKLTKNSYKNDFPFLNRDYKKGETFYLNAMDKKGCINIDGILNVIDDNFVTHKLPAGVLSILDEGKHYNIFLTESSNDIGELYSIEQPFNHMELLTQIQRPNIESKLNSRTVLKTEIKNSIIIQSIISLKEINPLF